MITDHGPLSCVMGCQMTDDPRVRAARSGRTGMRLRAMVKQLGTHLCWICGESIDMGLPPSHPKGWTMDHVKPVSLYPELAREPANIREAHRDCNGVRGQNIDHGRRANSSRDY